MLIKSILSENRTLAKISSTSKKRTLEKLANLFATEMDLDDANEIFSHFINRERLGSTGIGLGIAIPHCRFNTDGKTLCACVTLSNPIDFDAVDNEPVDIVFAMLVPENAENDHLETLAKLAESLQQGEYVRKLRSAESSVELYQAAVT